MSVSARLDLNDVLEPFEHLEDPRSTVNRLHALSSVVVIAILDVLACSNGPTAIVDWVKTKGRFLEKLLDLPHGVPSNHWSIENTCHWCLDVTYREDESRIREKNLCENFAWLNRFTLSLLKQIPDKLSVARRRRMCGWSEEYLMQVVRMQGECVR